MPGHLVFHVLGPLEIERDGSPLPVRGSKLRGLLAVLLFEAGELLTQEMLIDALWGEEPPPTARTALQMHISRLRKLLEGDPAVTLETKDGGYVLHLGADQLDLETFRRLVAQGQAEMARGEYRAASETLGAALELWRGTPLLNVVIPGLPESQVAGLEETAMSARAARIEAELALGNHMEVLPELETLRTAFPLDERVHVLDAIALHRAGRPAEALEAIAHLRRRLSTELGIEPGPAIRRVEEQILTQDPALDPPATDERVSRTLRKTVAALVCRFTAESTSVDPEAGKAALDEATERAREIVETHGGWMHEIVVGKVGAVFGVPSVHEDDAVRAVRAAAELRISRIEEDDAGENPDRPVIRVGIGLGEVLVQSSHGVERLLTLGPLEDAEQLARGARPGEVLLSEPAAKLLEYTTGLEPAEILLLEADASPLIAFRLLEGAGRHLEGRRFDSALVGRQQELAVLRQGFTRSSREPTASLVTLLGPAGLGKTRLVAEFLAGIRQEATVLSGRCLSYGRDITFWPITEMVRQVSAIEDSDGADEARAKVSRVIAGIDDAEFIEEQVASVMGMSGTPPVPGEIFWAIRSFFEAVALDRPLVMVFDDIHWAETTLLDLIEHLAASSRGVPLLVVCMARPDLLEQRLGWGGGRIDATNLTLTSLGREESSRLVDNLLGSGELDEADRERILEAGEGHPLFLEELVVMLVEEELLQWRNGRWVTSANLGEVPIPPTVQALIAARIDRLGASERTALEYASVIGTEFTERNLTVFGTDRGRAGPLLDALEAKDLIQLRRESPSAGRTFRFRHHLIRDVVYRAMPKAARAEAHEAFGDQLETGAGGRVAELEEIVGYHFEAAYRYRTDLRLQGPETSSLAARAASHLRSAGARAFARDDNPAAASLLGRALALLDTGDMSRADVAWQLGAALFETGALGRAEAALDDGLRDARRLGAEVADWRIRLEQTDIQFWRIPEAASTLEIERFAIDAIANLQRLGDLGGVARAQRLLGDALGRRGNLAEAVEAYESGRRLAREVGDEREATQRSNLGVAHGPLPVDRCIEIARRNLAEARRPVPETLAGLGFLLAMTGSFDESRKAFEDAIARASQLGIEWRLASINMHFGAAMLYADDPAGAEAVLRPAVEALQEMGEQSMFSTAVALLGEALYRLGRMDDALAAADASAEATAEDDVASQMAWRGVRAKVLAAAGELSEAEGLAREGVSYADRSDLLNMAGDAHFDLGVVLEAADRHVEAAAQFEAAAGLYSRKGNAMSIARARRASPSIHTGAGAGA